MGLRAESHWVSLVTALCGPQLSPHLKLPGMPSWYTLQVYRVSSIDGEDRQISSLSSSSSCCVALKLFLGLILGWVVNVPPAAGAEWRVCSAQALLSCWRPGEVLSALWPNWIEKDWRFYYQSLSSLSFDGECIGQMLLLRSQQRIKSFLSKNFPKMWTC